MPPKGIATQARFAFVPKRIYNRPKTMVALILFVLIILWFLGYIHLPALPIGSTVLFTLFGISVTLYQLLVFLIILYLVRLLPGFFRDIAIVLLALWILAIFGLITILNLPDLIVLILIFALAYYLIAGGS